MQSFGARLSEAVRARGPVCVGLDPQLPLMPAALLRGLPPPTDPGYRAAAAAAFGVFSDAVIDAAATHAAALKPQAAFFEALGAPGVAAMEAAVARARAKGLLVILDAKRGDIGSTAEAYAAATLDDDGPTGADAVTVSPYLGAESLAPFTARASAGKGIFVLLRTSNPGSGAWQGEIALRVAEWLTEREAVAPGSAGAVVGATLPEEAGVWRRRLPDTWFLVPGFGAQGAGIPEIRPHFRADGLGALVVSARAVLYPAAGRDDGEGWRDALHARAAAFARDLASLRG